MFIIAEVTTFQFILFWMHTYLAENNTKHFVNVVSLFELLILNADTYKDTEMTRYVNKLLLIKAFIYLTFPFCMSSLSYPSPKHTVERPKPLSFFFCISITSLLLTVKFKPLLTFDGNRYHLLSNARAIIGITFRITIANNSKRNMVMATDKRRFRLP